MKPKDDFEFGDLAEPDEAPHETRGQSSAPAASPDDEGEGGPAGGSPPAPPPLRLLDDHLLTPGGAVGSPDSGPGFDDDAFGPASGGKKETAEEERDRRRRPPGVLPVSDPRALDPAASGRKPSSGGGTGSESARTGIHKSDNEENVYVLLEDKPEPPSKPSFMPPVEAPPDLDADAPLAATAPESSADVSHDPLKATESLDEAGVFEAAGAGERSGSHRSDPGPGAAAGEEKVAEDLDEEPEFLYPKQAVSSRVSAKLTAEKKPGLSGPARALLFIVIAAALGLGATYGVRFYLGESLNGGSSGNGGNSTGGSTSNGGQKPPPPGAALNVKLRRSLEWGLPPAGNKPAGTTPGSDKR